MPHHACGGPSSAGAREGNFCFTPAHKRPPQESVARMKPRRHTTGVAPAQSGGHDMSLAPDFSNPQSFILFHRHPDTDAICDAFLGPVSTSCDASFSTFLWSGSKERWSQRKTLFAGLAPRKLGPRCGPATKRGGPRSCSSVPSRWFRHRRHRFGRGLIMRDTENSLHDRHPRGSGEPEHLHRTPCFSRTAAFTPMRRFGNAPRGC